MLLKKHLLLLYFIVLSSISFAQSEEGITTIILVRHAEKMVSDSADPDLSPSGIERALRLKQLLINTNIDAIYSTNFLRTKNTVLPLSEALHLEVKLYDPRNREITDVFLSKHEGETILISGHSNTTPQMVNTLINQQKYTSLDEKEYSKIFIVNISKQKETKVIELTY
ncbi:MAG: histidine phosphatase family protein [Cyclobacteriaceae bacterium]|nr:histidine phosphatase family protein [Cyclobacteriaceae bacterium]